MAQLEFLKNGYYSLVVCPRGRDCPRTSPDNVVKLNDGSLLLPYCHKTGRADEATEITKGKRSTDGGRTWGRSFTIFPNEAKMHCGTGGWLRLGSGELAVAFYRMEAYDNMQIYLLRSSDEGKTFGEPARITPREGYNCPCNGRLVQLDGGRLIYPVAYTSRSRAADENYSTIVCYSDDGGATWRESRSELRAAKRGLMEPVIAEIADGRCLMLMRTQLGSQYQSFSDDGGETWSAVEPSALVCPEAGAHLARVPNTRDLLACWNYDYKPHWHRRHYGLRCPLTVAISRDGGRTWENIKDLEDDHRYAYMNPSIGFIDGYAYVTYARGHWISQWGIMDAKLTIVPIDFFYNDHRLDRAFREMPQPKAPLGIDINAQKK